MKTKATLDTTSYAWKKIADNWVTYFFAPSRPSHEEVKRYQEWLKTIANGSKGLKGLVLGATPELRDALNQLHFKTHAIDINIEMIQALNNLVEHKNPDEVLVKANWLDNPLQSGYFDVILGDAVFPNIPWEQQHILYGQIKRLLKPGGIFINRAFFAPEKKRYGTIDEILTAFEAKKSSYQTAIELVFEIQLLTHNPKDRLGSMAKVKSMVEKLRSKNGFTFKSVELNKTLDILWDYWLRRALLRKYGFILQNKRKKLNIKNTLLLKRSFPLKTIHMAQLHLCIY